MAKNIINTKSNTLISGTSGNDTLRNGTGYSKKGGNRVTINGGAGNDNIHNAYYSSNVKINGEKGEDYIISYSKEKVTINGGADDDFIGNHSEKSSINGGAGDDYIYNHADDVTIIGGKGNDEIKLYDDGTETLIKYNSGDGNDTIIGFGSDSTLSVSGSYSTQESGYDVLVKTGSSTITLKNVYATADKVRINGKSTTLKRKTIKLTTNNSDIYIYRDSISVIGSVQSDLIYNYGEKVNIDAGKGDDYVDILEDDNTIIGGKGNDEIKLYDDGTETLIKYNSGDGNDTIIGFGADSTLQIGGGSYSTKKSGDNVIVTVGKGKISLMGVASLSKVNIKSAKSTSTNLTVTDKTKSPVTVGSAIKTINASKRTTAIKITGNNLANAITGGSGKDTIYGGSGNDSILGNAGNDKIYGQAGNDILRGGKGNNTLWGGKGNDSLWGNDGDNVFVYANGDGKDVIYGFEDDDMLKITGSFTGTYNKSKKEVYFKVGTTANAITLKDFGSTSTFNVNGTNYKISGSKLVKK